MPESVPALSHPPGKPHRSSLNCPDGAGRKGGRWDFFFFFFLFGNKKFLGLGEILCATAVPRGSPAPPALPPLPWPPVGERGEGGDFLGRGKCWGARTVSRPPQTWKKKKKNPIEEGGRGEAPAGGDRPIHLCSLAQVGRSPAPAATSSWPASVAPHSRQPVKA